MRLVIGLDHRFLRSPDGKIWTTTLYSRPFWDRYLQVFDEILIAARVDEIPAAEERLRRVDGDAVSLLAVPHFLGPRQYMTRARHVRQVVRSAVEPGDAVLCRMPSTIGITLGDSAAKRGIPFGVQVVGDPARVFTRGVVDHPLRALFQRWFSIGQRRLCSRAGAVAYGAEALRAGYPAGPGAFTVLFSDVELPDSAFAASPRRYDEQPGRRLIFVGSLAQPYKGVAPLLNAFARSVATGLDLELRIVGDGKLRGEYEQLADRLGIRERVDFLGELPGSAAVRDRLDAADLFILPSLTEGMPRALLEAMARGLPCIGSAIGGIPELLEPAELVVPGDAGSLEARIREVVTDPERLDRMSARNLEVARGYRQSEMSARQESFYRELRRLAERSTRG